MQQVNAYVICQQTVKQHLKHCENAPCICNELCFYIEK